MPASLPSSEALKAALKKSKDLKQALARSYSEPGQLDQQLNSIVQQLHALDVQLNGQGSKNGIGEKNHKTIIDRLGVAMLGTSFSTYGPTATHLRSMAIANEQFKVFQTKLNDLLKNKIPAFEVKLQKAGAPWVTGGELPD